MGDVVLITSRSFGTGTVDSTPRLEEAGLIVVRGGADHDLGQLGDVLRDTVGAGTGPVTAQHLAAAPRLRIVARYGTGVDNVDLAATQDRGVVITNVFPGANAEAVADHTLALLLAALRPPPWPAGRISAVLRP